MSKEIRSKEITGGPGEFFPNRGLRPIRVLSTVQRGEYTETHTKRNRTKVTEAPARKWPFIFTATTAADPNSNQAQTLEINITSLPEGGANWRVAKTTANGNWFSDLLNH